MHIHRVAGGESLWTIAKANATTPSEIVALNGLANDTQLVPGLNLLLPREQPALPTAATGKRTIEVNGYLIPTGMADATTVNQVAPYLTYLSVFSYQARANGELQPQPDTAALNAASAGRVQPLVTITNFDGNNFNPSLAHAIMSDGALRARLIANAINTAKSKGYQGINVDFEHMNPSDRPLYNSFIRAMGAAAHSEGLSISIAMGPKTSDSPQQAWMGAFDYRALGQEVDFLMLMTYEWGWVGGPPMDGNRLQQMNTGLTWTRKTIHNPHCAAVRHIAQQTHVRYKGA